MENTSRLGKLEKSIVRNKRLTFTVLSYLTVLAIFINLSWVGSIVIGTATSLVFFVVNGTFLGWFFFENEDPFIRFLLGALSLVALLGLVSWSVMIAYNLDVVRSAIALFVVSTVCSFLNKSKWTSKGRLNKFKWTRKGRKSK
jgi:hypothetical protein